MTKTKEKAFIGNVKDRSVNCNARYASITIAILSTLTIITANQNWFPNIGIPLIKAIVIKTKNPTYIEPEAKRVLSTLLTYFLTSIW